MAGRFGGGSYRQQDGGAAEGREGGVRGRQQVGGGGQALDEGARRGELPVLLRRAVPGLPALRRHVALETLHPAAHAGVEPARPGQAALRHAGGRETSKRRDAEELWGT